MSGPNAAKSRVSSPSALGLAAADQYQFQCWALGLVGARPAQGKKGADKGIDGQMYFHEGEGPGTKQVILSVKAGKLHAPALRARSARGGRTRQGGYRRPADARRADEGHADRSRFSRIL